MTPSGRDTMTAGASPGPWRPVRLGWIALLVDLIAVAAFVAIGRTAHSHGLGLAGLVSTFWPFGSGLAAAWLVITYRRFDGFGLPAGLVAWLATVALGMALRVVGGQGVDVVFVLVALGFVGLFLLGWRTVARLLWRHGG